MKEKGKNCRRREGTGGWEGVGREIVKEEEKEVERKQGTCGNDMLLVILLLRRKDMEEKKFNNVSLEKRVQNRTIRKFLLNFSKS